MRIPWKSRRWWRTLGRRLKSVALWGLLILVLQGIGVVMASRGLALLAALR